MAASFLAVNRGKKGLTLDLKQPEGVAVLKRLVATADVLVENYRPGVATRLGVDYETLAAVNPRLIYCSVSGFGQTGPYASRGGYDLIAQGMAGIMSATGSDGGPPVKVGVPVADLGAGLFAVLGILCALRARRITGRGQRVDTSLFEAALALSAWEATEYWYTGQIPKRLGTAHRLNAPYQAFRASDGYFTVGAANAKLWPLFAKLIGIERPHPGSALQGRGRSREEPGRARGGDREGDAHGDARPLAREVRGGGHSRRADLQHAGGPGRSARAGARHGARRSTHPQAGRVKTLGNPVKLSRSPAVAAVRRARARRRHRRGPGRARLSRPPRSARPPRAKKVRREAHA